MVLSKRRVPLTLIEREVRYGKSHSDCAALKRARDREPGSLRNTNPTRNRVYTL
jgi:hypothetical protein